MARYEYSCPECTIDGNTTITVVEKPMADYDKKELCRTCGATMKKLISESSFSLKGSGWARDRYSGKGNT